MPDAFVMRMKVIGENSHADDPQLIREPDGDQFLKRAPDSPALKAGHGTP